MDCDRAGPVLPLATILGRVLLVCVCLCVCVCVCVCVCNMCICVCCARYLVANGTPQKMMDYLVLFELESGFDGEYTVAHNDVKYVQGQTQPRSVSTLL